MSSGIAMKPGANALWSPEQYERFRAERKLPFSDLLALVEPRASMRIADLGCGTGELTRELHDTLQASNTVGVDNSEAMLAKSPEFRAAGIDFVRADLQSFRPAQQLDLVFSNAALHWVPDHESLFATFTQWLAPGGQIAVQMPVNDAHPSHAIAASVAETRYGLEPRVSPVLSAEAYAVLLDRLGFRRQHVRVQVYGHTLAASEDVVEWVRGTLLTDYERRLGNVRFPQFVEDYREALLSSIGRGAPYFYTFRRMLLHAA